MADLLSNADRAASAAAPDPAPARPSATRDALALRAEHGAELLRQGAANLRAAERHGVAPTLFDGAPR